MKIEQGRRVTLEYELSVVGGDVIESSARTGPLVYVHGSGKMLPGLERQVEGLAVGDERDGVIPAALAYGEEDSLPTKQIPRSEFPADEEIEIGKRFEANDADGHPIAFVVLAVNDDAVSIRFSHPLAGMDIRYKVKVLKIDNPPADPPPPPVD